VDSARNRTGEAPARGRVEEGLIPRFRKCFYVRCAGWGKWGERHGPFYLLTWSEGGKTRSKHIPREKAGQVEEMTANYREAKRLLDELSRANLELVSSGRNKK